MFRRPGLTKRLIYKLGFRPKRGSIMHSPTLEINYAVKNAADAWKRAFNLFKEN